MWVLEAGGALVGVIALERFGTDGLLRSLAVAPEFRNRGLRRDLVTRLEKYAREDGVYDRLMAQATGQAKVELLPESETEFFLKAIDAQITFVKDEKGIVTHLILHQGGDRSAKKLK